MCNKGVSTRVQGKDRTGKIGLRHLYDVKNKNARGPLMISLFKNLPANKSWSRQVKNSVIERRQLICLVLI